MGKKSKNSINGMIPSGQLEVVYMLVYICTHIYSGMYVKFFEMDSLECVTSLLGEVSGMGREGNLYFLILCFSLPSEFSLPYAYIAFILKIKFKNAL